jgi:hypothetical protein
MNLELQRLIDELQPKKPRFRLRNSGVFLLYFVLCSLVWLHEKALDEAELLRLHPEADALSPKKFAFGRKAIIAESKTNLKGKIQA